MYTALYKKVKGGYVAWVEEVPGAHTQGTSKREAQENLKDALKEVLLARRILSKKESRNSDVVRERFALYR